MNSTKLSGIAVVAAMLLANTGSIAFGAAPAQNAAPSASVSADTPELQSAAQRVDASRSKLDQARQQLSAAKAMLKAAEAEFRAAKADQEALSLRTQARKMADASGLQQDSSTPVTRLYPANVAPTAVPQSANNNPVMPTPAPPISACVGCVWWCFDVTTTTTGDVTDGMAPVAPLKGAPLPN